MIALLVVTDGREDYLTQCLASVKHLTGPIGERWMFDDTGDNTYRARLAESYPEFRHINAGPRQGYGGAIRAAWAQLRAHSNADWVFHLEQDFIIDRTVDLSAMVDVLTSRPHLAQMALRRQAWNSAERAAGGVIEQHPGDYTDMYDAFGRSWLEHRRFFTTNPCLYRRTLCDMDWPEGAESEGRFTHQILTAGTPEVAGLLVRFGYWGERGDDPWVSHIGHNRTGVGY